tara:strand:- start:169 stop:561 length:393 start_codon:yes stop_codon:yes gene_type:complete
MAEEKEKPKLPSFATMAKNFARDLAEYVKAGAPNVSESRYKNRLNTCKKCPDLIKEAMRCGKCGCLVEHKAKWKTTKCPADKWTPEVLSATQKEKLEQMRAKKYNEQRKRENDKAVLDAKRQKDNSKTSD